MWALVIPSAKWNQRTKGSTSSIWDPASWESIPLVATWHGKHGKELGFYPHILWMKARGNIKGQRLGMFIFTQLLKPIAIHWVSENNRFFFLSTCWMPEAWNQSVSWTVLPPEVLCKSLFLAMSSSADSRNSLAGVHIISMFFFSLFWS